jgi:hypothetical protein
MGMRCGGLGDPSVELGVFTNDAPSLGATGADDDVEITEGALAGPPAGHAGRGAGG